MAVFENPPIIQTCENLDGEISLGNTREFYPQWNLQDLGHCIQWMNEEGR